MINNTPSLALLVSLSNDTLSTTIDDRRPDALAIFAPLPDAQRASLAEDAWVVGLRAVMNAHRAAEESRLQDIGKALLDDVDVELREHVRVQQEAMVRELQRYFDPNDGQIVTRINGFLKDGGELSRSMERFLGPEHGVLANTLAKALGEQSPLLRRLSPTDSEGVVSLIEARVREALEMNRTAVAKALDPLVPDGAVARFLGSLKQDLEKADGERTKQLALATKALDANDETSLLSRLVRETQKARATVLETMNPESPGSPLAMLKTSLTVMLETHAKSQAEVMDGINERQKKFEQDMRDVVTRLDERKRGDASSPRGGRRFEDQVCLFTRSVLGGVPVFVEDTGNTTGDRSSCKVGDQVVRFHSESVYAGSSVVIEAKRAENYTMAKALTELELARSNRNAQAGVFVLAKSAAPSGFARFSRCGNDVVVVWDENDEGTDAYLQAAVFLALGLASRHKRGDDEGNIKALADVEHKIERELKRHEKMRALVETIQKKADELADELRIGTKGLNGLVRDAKATLKALNVELANVEEERAEPLELPAGELGDARAALSAA